VGCKDARKGLIQPKSKRGNKEGLGGSTKGSRTGKKKGEGGSARSKRRVAQGGSSKRWAKCIKNLGNVGLGASMSAAGGSGERRSHENPLPGGGQLGGEGGEATWPLNSRRYRKPQLRN